MAAVLAALLLDDIASEEVALLNEELLIFEDDDGADEEDGAEEDERTELELDDEELSDELIDELIDELREELADDFNDELFAALEEESDDAFELELDEGVTAATELADDARDDDLLDAELLSTLALDATDERDDEIELKLELVAIELELTRELDELATDELIAEELTEGEGCVAPPPPPPPQAVITNATHISKLALVATRISHHPLFLIFNWAQMSGIRTSVCGGWFHNSK